MQDIIEEQKRKEEKKLAAQEKKEMESLFRAVIKQPKVPPGVNPKTIICEYFRQGCCPKGAACKFSHDMELLQKKLREEQEAQAQQQPEDEKAALYANKDKLAKSVNAKFEARNKAAKCKTVCKYFLEALDSRKYGSRWECPNGVKCPYQHAIPKGWVIKRKDAPKEEEEEVEEEVPLEEIIDEEVFVFSVSVE